jgi:hypothetical protein
MSLPNAVSSGARKIRQKNAQFNTMLCKGKMNFVFAKRKMAGNRWRGFPPLCPAHVGGGPRAKSIQCITTLAAVYKKMTFAAFCEPEAWSLRGYGADLNGVAFQSAGYSGILAGLLVERGQSRLVGGVQDIDFLAYDQSVLGAFGYAGAGALRGRAFHVLFAAHGIADLAGEGLFLGCERIQIEKCSR